MLSKIQTVLKIVWAGVDGWKSIVAYVLLQLPFFAANPMLVEAIEKAVNAPTAENIGSAMLQGLLALALAHKAVKNVTAK